MEVKLLFYSFLVLCFLVFFDVLINIKKVSLLKILLLLIISSLFIMNYYALTSITNRPQFILIKAMRIVYFCSTLILIIHLAGLKIRHWISLLLFISATFLIGMRLYYYNEINIEEIKPGGYIFSVGYEFNRPIWLIRFILFVLLNLAMAITIYYFLLPSKKNLKKNQYYRHLNQWINFLSIPFFLLMFFGMLSIFNILKEFPYSSSLFSLFSFISISAILFRPRFLNTLPVSVAFIPSEKRIGSFISRQSFNDIFFNEFYYLEEKASLNHLAGKLKATITDTREYLQEEFGMEIEDLLNKQRVTYMLDLLKKEDNRKLPMEQLSEKAGFNSASSMYLSFLKFEGGNLSAYIEDLNRLYAAQQSEK